MCAGGQFKFFVRQLDGTCWALRKLSKVIFSKTGSILRILPRPDDLFAYHHLSSVWCDIVSCVCVVGGTSTTSGSGVSEGE